MLLERAELLAREGGEVAMLEMMTDRCLPLLAAVPGVRSVTLGRGVENPDKFLLLVEWDSLAAHEAFSRSPVSDVFRALITPLSRGGAMEHFEMNETATI